EQMTKANDQTECTVNPPTHREETVEPATANSEDLRPPVRRGASSRLSRALLKGLMAVVKATFVASTVLVVPVAVAPVADANSSASLDHCANDPPPSSPLDGCT